MGFTPAQVDQMTPWEFSACLDGWKLANGGGKSGGGDISDERLREMGIEGF